MNNKFDTIYKKLGKDLEIYFKRFSSLDASIISERKNKQDRSIKQILGHMIDSASNNTHRIIHLQYGVSPLEFPNYATNGNNDRWISIQNYQDEDWELLLNLWRYIHLHLIYVIGNIDDQKLQNIWLGGDDETVTLEEMVMDFPRHFYLHIQEIEELMR